MVFTLQDLMELPLLKSSRPQILVGNDFDQREVRWVHTSEIFEISPLLKGGEVLFTTGLGLVGAPIGAITNYVESLARQNVTALIMEVGRTFVNLPAEFEVAAAKYGLPLITMHQVVPFVEITEAVHPLLIDAEVMTLRRRGLAFRQLTDGLLAGDDLGGVLSHVRGLVNHPVGLYSHGGQLLAGDDVRELYSVETLTELAVGPEHWAYLVSPVQETIDADVMDLAASMVALKMTQMATGSPSRALAVSDLLSDMISGNHLGDVDIESRASSLGFVLNPRRRSLALVVDLTRSARDGLTVVTKAARREFGPNLVAELDGHIYAVLQLRPDVAVDEQLHGLALGIERELSEGGTGKLVRIVSGPIADSIQLLVKSLVRAHEGARLARKLGLRKDVITERDLGIYDLLTRVVPDVELESFVEQQLGPLLQADARSGHRLMETLNAYLEAGRSKSIAAEVLGVRRQTLYHRLERIAEVLGGIDLASHERLTSLDLAVTVWRMRTSGLTGSREI